MIARNCFFPGFCLDDLFIAQKLASVLVEKVLAVAGNFQMPSPIEFFSFELDYGVGFAQHRIHLWVRVIDFIAQLFPIRLLGPMENQFRTYLSR